jgi:DNA repair exonuclease SbcCD ATPase subunit
MTIFFKKLRYQNLLSTGNQFTELDLCRSKSTLIVGENGAGKSTLIDALTFALYGRPFRNINKPQLLNAITGKGLVVELEFSIGKKDYMIRRGIKPTIFEIWQNDQMLNQNAGARDDQEYLEKHILKLNFKSFSQIVVLGSANYVPFMQLPAQQRRSVVEDLLDIQIFSVMNSLLKDKINSNKSDIAELEYKVNLCEQKIELHSKHIDALKANNDELVEQKHQKIVEHQKAIVLHQATVDGLISQVEDLNLQIADQGKVSSRKTKLLQMESTLEDRIRKLNKEIQFFHDHDNCPTCKQGIDHDFKIGTLEKRSDKKSEIEQALEKLEAEIVAAQERLEFIERTNDTIQRFNASIQSNNQQITFYQRTINDLNKEIEGLVQQGNKIYIDMDNTEVYEQELKQFNKQKEQLVRQKAVYDVAAHLLKDTGIKTRIIKQYVPVMNKLINKYLAVLDFFVEFTLDESFNETIKSRFRDEFTYASFSEGEKMRVDLALMMTWRAIAKLRNSASTNLLIMDEVFDSSLDATGTEEFIKMLESMTPDTNTFIISHKGDQLFDRFESIIRFEKHSNFSRIAQ